MYALCNHTHACMRCTAWQAMRQQRSEQWVQQVVPTWGCMPYSYTVQVVRAVAAASSPAVVHPAAHAWDTWGLHCGTARHGSG